MTDDIDDDIEGEIDLYRIKTNVLFPGDIWLDPNVLSPERLQERQAAPPLFHSYAEILLAKVTEALGKSTTATLETVIALVRDLGWISHWSYLWECDFTDQFIEACQRNGLFEREGCEAVVNAVYDGLAQSKHDPLPYAKLERWGEEPNESDDGPDKPEQAEQEAPGTASEGDADRCRPARSSTQASP